MRILAFFYFYLLRLSFWKISRALEVRFGPFLKKLLISVSIMGNPVFAIENGLQNESGFKKEKLFFLFQIGPPFFFLFFDNAQIDLENDGC